MRRRCDGDIHDYKKKLEKSLASLDKQPFSEKDKKAIRNFIDKLQLQSISVGRRAKYVQHLKVVARTLNELTNTDRGLCKATKEDLDRLSLALGV